MVAVTESGQAPVAREGTMVARSVDHVSRFLGLAVGNLYIICAAVTLYEVVARYVFNAPTQWAFEVVMVLCASAWMLSAGFVTLQKRHIGITVFYLMASDRVRWWLDLFAMVVGVFALYMLISDTLIRALDSIDLVERAGTGWNSPLPMILKTVLVVGLFIYLIQLLMNLSRHFQSRTIEFGILLLTALIVARYVLQIGHHYMGEASVFGVLDGYINTFGENTLNLNDSIDVRSYGIGVVSLGIVAVLLMLMMTGMPLGIVTLIISVVCAFLFFGPKGLYLVSTNAFGLLEKYPLVAVPLFVLMATILERAGIAEDLFDAMSIFAGNLRGGVALQTTIVAVILAAMSGVMGGEIVMLGLVALPQLLRLKYDRKMAIGLICASGALATLIPPSIVMIVYGLSADVAIGDLFAAGFIPGLMLANVLRLLRADPLQHQPVAGADRGRDRADGRHRAYQEARDGTGHGGRSLRAADRLCHGLDLRGHRVSDRSSRRRRLRRHNRRRRPPSVQLCAAARLACQHDGRCRHDYLADPGRGRFRRALQPDRRRRLHALAVRRPWPLAARHRIRDDGDPGRARHLHGVDRDHLHHGARLRTGCPRSGT